MLWRVKYARFIFEHISLESNSEYATTLDQMSKRAIGGISPDMDKAKQCLYRILLCGGMVFSYGELNWEVYYMYGTSQHFTFSFF